MDGKGRDGTYNFFSRRLGAVAFIMGKRYFLPITWLNLRRSALKVTK